MSYIFLVLENDMHCISNLISLAETHFLDQYDLTVIIGFCLLLDKTGIETDKLIEKSALFEYVTKKSFYTCIKLQHAMFRDRQMLLIPLGMLPTPK